MKQNLTTFWASEVKLLLKPCKRKLCLAIKTRIQDKVKEKQILVKINAGTPPRERERAMPKQIFCPIDKMIFYRRNEKSNII